MNFPARLYDVSERGVVRCRLCAHECRIRPGQTGICGVRANVDGTLYSTVYGEPIALHVDPIEKKPLYHFLPGTLTYSLATIGCNFQCDFCQNWQISQRRDGGSFRASPESEAPSVSPAEIVRRALERECPSISYTYTEPTIFFEYAMDTAAIAREKGLKNIFVTNGFMTGEAVDEMARYLDAANVDLKSFRDEFYRIRCKGRLQPVLDSIERMLSHGIWVEVTTLVIPDVNDSDEELKEIAEFLAGLSRDLPWHVTRFHPDYHFPGSEWTSRNTLERARKIGVESGLINVHVGNI